MTHPSPEEISTVLGFLTPHSKSAFIAEKSRDQNMPWLRGLAAQGAFLVPQDIFYRSPGASNARFADTTILGFPNVVALAGVIDGADFEVLAQPHSVTRAKPVTLRVCDDFKAFLFDTALALMQAAIEFRDNEKASEGSNGQSHPSHYPSVSGQTCAQRKTIFNSDIEATFLSLLQTACACDDGKTANLLLQGTNRLGTMYSPSMVLGAAAALLPGDNEQRSQARVNPMYTAMVFSAHDALEAMEKHGFPLQKTIALYPRAVGETKSTDPLKVQYPDAYSPRMPIDFIASNAFPCEASMLERVVNAHRKEGYRAIDVEPLVNEALRLLKKERVPYEEDCKKAFERCSVFELKGKASVRIAMDKLDFSLVDRLETHIHWLEDVPFGGTPYHWEVTSLFTIPMARNEPVDLKAEGPSGSEAMVLKLMDFGARAGHGHRFYAQQNPHQATLVKWAIEKDHPKVLIKMMENGLDPEGHLLLNDTAYGLAEKAGKKEAEHAMRTYLLGKRARTALADMDLEAGAALPVQTRPI